MYKKLSCGLLALSMAFSSAPALLENAVGNDIGVVGVSANGTYSVGGSITGTIAENDVIKLYDVTDFSKTYETSALSASAETYSISTVPNGEYVVSYTTGSTTTFFTNKIKVEDGNVASTDGGLALANATQTLVKYVVKSGVNDVELSKTYELVTAVANADYPTDNNGGELTWDPAVGALTTDGGIATATVTASYVAVSGITGLAETGTAETDLVLSGTVEPSNATNQTIVWTVSSAGDTGAEIDADGKTLKTTGAGTVKIKATITNGATTESDYEKEFSIVINASGAHVAVTEITGVPTTGTAETDLVLSGTVAPTNATNQTIVWSVSSVGDTGATIDTDGKTLKTTGAGTVEVTATITDGTSADGEAYTQKFSITISAAGAHVPVTEITEVATTGTVGEDITLSGTVEPSTATNQTIVWSVTDAGATGAEIDTDGKTLKTTGAGTVKIKATITDGTDTESDYEKEFSITISAAGEHVAVTEITGVPTTGTVGDTSLTGTVAPTNATKQDIVWSVTNADGTGATIDTDGKTLKTTGAGTVTVTATITGGGTSASEPYTKNFDIVISAANTHVPVTGITGVAADGTVGEDIILSGTVAPSNATNQTIVWTVSSTDSGDTGATITGSTLKTTAAGTVTVTATITGGTSTIESYTKDFDIVISGSQTQSFGSEDAAVEALNSLLGKASTSTSLEALFDVDSSSSSSSSVDDALVAGKTVTATIDNLEIALKIDPTDLVFAVAVKVDDVSFAFDAGDDSDTLDFFADLLTEAVTITETAFDAESADAGVASSTIKFVGNAGTTPKMDLTFEVAEANEGGYFFAQKSGTTWSKGGTRYFATAAVASMARTETINVVAEGVEAAINSELSVMTATKATNEPTLATGISEDLTGMVITFTNSENSEDVVTGTVGAYNELEFDGTFYSDITYEVTITTHPTSGLYSVSVTKELTWANSGTPISVTVKNLFELLSGEYEVYAFGDAYTVEGSGTNWAVNVLPSEYTAIGTGLSNIFKVKVVDANDTSVVMKWTLDEGQSNSSDGKYVYTGDVFTGFDESGYSIAGGAKPTLTITVAKAVVTGSVDLSLFSEETDETKLKKEVQDKVGAVTSVTVTDNDDKTYTVDVVEWTNVEYDSLNDNWTAYGTINDDDFSAGSEDIVATVTVYAAESDILDDIEKLTVGSLTVDDATATQVIATVDDITLTFNGDIGNFDLITVKEFLENLDSVVVDDRAANYETSTKIVETEFITFTFNDTFAAPTIQFTFDVASKGTRNYYLGELKSGATSITTKNPSVSKANGASITRDITGMISNTLLSGVASVSSTASPISGAGYGIFSTSYTPTYSSIPTTSNGSTGGSTYNAASYYDSGSVRVNGTIISELQNVLVGELVNLDLITTVNGREVLGWYYDSALTNQITNTSQFVITSDMIANGLFVKLAGASDTLIDGSTNAGAGNTSNTYVPSYVPSTIAKLLGKLF